MSTIIDRGGPVREHLMRFQPRHDSFVGIDSDGCVFDSMDIKQKRCFHGLIVSHWGLEAIEPLVRETAEFVNLRSIWRGQNRFMALLKTFDLLRERRAVRASGVAVPLLPDLRALAGSGRPLGHPVLRQAIAETGSEELASLLAWSLAVNEDVARRVRRLPPFEWARRSLERLQAQSDVICVSQTPYEALAREWKDNGLTPLVSLIAGQELGTKAEHLQWAAVGKYAANRILMIGDAPGDLQAARASGVLFYPINPGEEEVSWKRFHDEAYDRFLAGTYQGAYENARTAEFQARLPETPSWDE